MLIDTFQDIEAVESLNSFQQQTEKNLFIRTVNFYFNLNKQKKVQGLKKTSRVTTP